MKRKYKTCFLILIVMIAVLGNDVEEIKVRSIAPYFTLVAKALESDNDRLDALYMIKNQLAKIGIDLEIMPIWSLVGELIAFRNFDLSEELSADEISFLLSRNDCKSPLLAL